MAVAWSCNVTEIACQCAICGHRVSPALAENMGMACGNTARHREQVFLVWKCPRCASIHALDPAEYAEIYKDYPLNRRTLDIFARGTLRNLLNRLKSAGLTQEHSILDYGCGNGVLIQFLQEQGYRDVTGYDPYISEYSSRPAGGTFDLVIANDTIEHVHDPRQMVADCAILLKPGGLLYIGTADSEPVDIHRLEREITRLHLPFHRVIISQATLHQLGDEAGLDRIISYRRSYMDTIWPFVNYRFLDELLKAHGHNMDAALEPSAGKVLLRKPSLLLFAFFGYWIPSAYEPAAVWRKPKA